MVSGSPTSVSCTGRVVEEDDGLVAAGDLLESAFERFHLERRLPVDLTQRRLSEVRDLGAGEAAHEAFRPGDPDLDIADLEYDVAPLEHDDARRLERRP